MPDLSGLHQQQAMAANVPYKNMALENPAEKFLNAWQLTTNMALKKDEFQGRMAALAQKNKALEYKMELDGAKFGLAMQKADMDAGFDRQRIDIAERRLQQQGEHQYTKQEWAEHKYNDAIAGKTGLFQIDNSLAAQGLKPGDERYINEANRMLAEIAGIVPGNVLNAWKRTLYQRHNDAANAYKTWYTAEEKRHRAKVGSTLYGSELETDTTPLYHPELYTQHTESESWWKPWTSKPTGDLILKGKDAQGNTIDRRVKRSDLQKLRRDDEQLEKFKTRIAPTIDAPEIGISSKPIIKFKSSSGKVYEASSQEQLEQAKQLDPGLTIVP